MSNPLPKPEFSALEEWLNSPPLAGKAMGIDKLQGFLCAVVSAPDGIAPSRWIPEALGGEPNFESKEQAKEFSALLVQFYQQIVSTLQESQPPTLILKARSETDPHPDYEAWCDGYILGWALSTEEWLQPGNEPLKKLTFPILLLSGAFKENAEAKGDQFMPEDEYIKLQQECMDTLPEAVAGIHDFWLSRRKSVHVTRESPKVGRNDPCPCGSGKKFKQCCGGERTVH